MKKALAVAVSTLAVFSIATVMVFTHSEFKTEGSEKEVHYIVESNKREQLDAVVEMMQAELNENEELSVYDYEYKETASASDSVSWWKFEDIPFTEKTIELTAEGIIKYGIDLDEVQITGYGNSIVVKIPHAKILSHSIKEETVKCNSKNGLFNDVTGEDYTNICILLKDNAEADAKKQGVIDVADETIKNSILNKLTMFSTYNVSVKFL